PLHYKPLRPRFSFREIMLDKPGQARTSPDTDRGLTRRVKADREIFFQPLFLPGGADLKRNSVTGADLPSDFGGCTKRNKTGDGTETPNFKFQMQEIGRKASPSPRGPHRR